MILFIQHYYGTPAAAILLLLCDRRPVSLSLYLKASLVPIASIHQVETTVWWLWEVQWADLGVQRVRCCVRGTSYILIKPRHRRAAQPWTWHWPLPLLLHAVATGPTFYCVIIR